jgi:hypothetical protein
MIHRQKYPSQMTMTVTRRTREKRRAAMTTTTPATVPEVIPT